MISGVNHPLDKLDQDELSFNDAIEIIIDGAIYERDLLWVRNPLERDAIIDAGPSEDYNPEYWDEVLEKCEQAQTIYDNCIDEEAAISAFHHAGLEEFADALESGCYALYLSFT